MRLCWFTWLTNGFFFFCTLLSCTHQGDVVLCTEILDYQCVLLVTLPRSLVFGQFSKGPQGFTASLIKKRSLQTIVFLGLPEPDFLSLLSPFFSNHE